MLASASELRVIVFNIDVLSRLICLLFVVTDTFNRACAKLSALTVCLGRDY